jgi:integrase
MAYRYGIIVQKLPKRRKPYLVRWKGEFNFNTGKHIIHGKSFPRKKDAELFAEQLQDEIDNGTDPRNKNIPVKDFLNKYLAFKKKDVRYKTYELYKQAIDEFLKFFHPTVPISKIQQEKCEEFLSQLDFVAEQHQNKNNKISDSTRHQYFRLLNTIFNKAVKWEYIEKNPFNDISLGTPTKKAWYFIQPQEFKALMTTIDNLPVYNKKTKDKQAIRKIRLKAFYSIMFGCGLRFGEAVNILWDDQNLDLQKDVVHIVNREGSRDMPTYNIKDYEARSIKMPGFVVKAITQLKEVDGNSSPFVFLCEDQWERVLGRWHCYLDQGIQEQWDSKKVMGTALKYFKSYCRKAGIITHKKLNLQSLRKAYGSNMAKVCPPHTLKELMGHSSIVTTMDYYIQDVDENKKQAIKQLDRMMEE